MKWLFIIFGILFLSACQTLQSHNSTYKYIADLPKDYSENAKKQYPLVIFLHGSGERGNNLKLVQIHGPPKLVKEGMEFPFILISPQLPNGEWNSEILDKTLLKISRKYRIDKSRIYVTGLSLGGMGTYDWAMKHPDLFAAIAPVAGFGDINRACEIAKIPIWIFHGALDDAVAFEPDKKMYENLLACGGNPKFTLYPDIGHFSWVPAYNDPNFYEWLLSQKNENGEITFDKLR